MRRLRPDTTDAETRARISRSLWFYCKESREIRHRAVTAGSLGRGDILVAGWASSKQHCSAAPAHLDRTDAELCPALANAAGRQCSAGPDGVTDAVLCNLGESGPPLPPHDMGRRKYVHRNIISTVKRLTMRCDKERGYSNRLVDLGIYIKSSGGLAAGQSNNSLFACR